MCASSYEEKRKKVWDSVVQEQKKVENVECFRLPHKKNEFPDDLPNVISYWVESGRPRINETALNESLAVKAATNDVEIQEVFMKNSSSTNFTKPLNETNDDKPESSYKNEGDGKNLNVTISNVSPTPKRIIDKMALDNFQIENWNPTAVPTMNPTVTPSIPYSFKKMTATDRMTFRSRVGS